MKDHFKNELNIGDLVVYLDNKRGKRGVIIGFTEHYSIVKMLHSMKNSRISNYYLVRYHKELLDPEYLTFYNQIVNDINTYTP